MAIADRDQFGMGSEEHTAEVDVEAGKVYQLEVRFSNFKQLSATSPYVSPLLRSQGHADTDDRQVGEAVFGSADVRSATLQRRSSVRFSSPPNPTASGSTFRRGKSSADGCSDHPVHWYQLGLGV